MSDERKVVSEGTITSPNLASRVGPGDQITIRMDGIERRATVFAILDDDTVEYVAVRDA